MCSLLQIVSQRPPPSRCVRNFYVNLVVFPDKNLFAAIQCYRTFSLVFSQRFSPLYPSSVARIKKACALEKWRHCVSALVFLSGIWFTLILVFTGRCRCSEWQKTSNNVCMNSVNSVKFISHSACIFNVVGFVYYKVHFVISVT